MIDIFLILFFFCIAIIFYLVGKTQFSIILVTIIVFSF